MKSLKNNCNFQASLQNKIIIKYFRKAFKAFNKADLRNKKTQISILSS